MSDDFAERLARLEAQQEHNQDAVRQIGQDVDKLEDARQDQANRTVKLEGKMSIIWAAVGGLATMVGAFIFNWFSKGGNP